MANGTATETMNRPSFLEYDSGFMSWFYTTDHKRIGIYQGTKAL